MKFNKVITLLVAAALLLALPGSVLAQEPAPNVPQGVSAEQVSNAFTYQGYLEKDGKPMEGTCDLQFAFFDSPDMSSANQIGATETKMATAVQKGKFSVLLNANATMDGFWGQQLYLEVWVRCPAGEGTYAALPVQKVTGVPFANGLKPGTVTKNQATSVWTVGFWSESTNGEGVVGLSRSADFRGVIGDNRAGGVGVMGVTTSQDHAAVQGTNGGAGAGVYGLNEAVQGTGVVGEAGNTNCTAGWPGGCSGVFGKSPKGIGVRGETTSGAGVTGWADGSGTGVSSLSVSGNLFTGTAGIWNPNLRFKVDNAGNVSADGTIAGGGADFAEMLPAEAGLEPGDVLVIGKDGQLTLSTEPNQASVAGVYSTQPGFVGGASETVEAQANSLEGKIPLAVVGVVPVKVSAENGAILPGDSLTTSSLPGHAMKATPITLQGVTFFPSGTVIGKALEGLESGTGVIQMLVVLQ